MKSYALILGLSLCASSIIGSDNLTIEEQNDEMNGAFEGKKLSKFSKRVEDDLTNAVKTISNKDADFIKLLYPSVDEAHIKEMAGLPKTAQAKLEATFGATGVSESQLMRIQRQAAETIFHRLNDALTFLLTSKKIAHSSLKRNPDLCALLCHQRANDEETNVNVIELPLLQHRHPVAILAQNYLFIKEFQYWIDVILILKNTAFPTPSISSYAHNALAPIKRTLQSYINTLKGRITSSSQSSLDLSQVKNHKDLLFLKLDNFYSNLVDCFTRIDDALPASTYSIITPEFALANTNNVENVLENTPGMQQSAATKEKLLPGLNALSTYFTTNFQTLLLGIRSMAVIESLSNTTSDPEERRAKLAWPFYAQALTIAQQILNGKNNYEGLFKGLTNNIQAVQIVRAGLGLPREIFNGIDFEKEMLKALKSYQISKKGLSQKKIEDKDVTSGQKVYEKTKTVEPSPIVQDANPPSKAIDVAPGEEESGEKKETLATVKDLVEDDSEESGDGDVYDETYFKRVHQEHQDRKNQTSSSASTTSSTSTQHAWSTYEIDLFTYLRDSIFRPTKPRSTWDVLVSSLSRFGFTGQPNAFGNGSTWEFSVTERNSLFFNNPEYNGATFNVHKFPGNEPIHPQYLKFFRTGFSNVFGLTEDYISTALTSQ